MSGGRRGGKEGGEVGKEETKAEEGRELYGGRKSKGAGRGNGARVIGMKEGKSFAEENYSVTEDICFHCP